MVSSVWYSGGVAGLYIRFRQRLSSPFYLMFLQEEMFTSSPPPAINGKWAPHVDNRVVLLQLILYQRPGTNLSVANLSSKGAFHNDVSNVLKTKTAMPIFTSRSPVSGLKTM